MYGVENVNNYNDAATGFAAFGIGYVIFVIILAVIGFAAVWKIFTKAGKAGWICLIPFYNYYTMFEVAKMNGWLFLLLFVPIVNIVISIMLCINLAKAFGKSTGFALGLIFLTFIFLLILAFGSAKYEKN